MDNITINHENIATTIEKIKEETVLLKETYNKFFRFDDIFLSDQGGKTKLDKSVFNKIHELIQNHILNINSLLDDSIQNIDDDKNRLLIKYLTSEEIELLNKNYEDTTFLKSLETKLDSKVIAKESKDILIQNIEEWIKLKNRLFNYKYYVTIFDTSNINNYINKLGIDDFINNKFIFELIDTYGLQLKELEKFQNELKTLKSKKVKINNLKSSNSLLELLKRRFEHYILDNTRHIISIEYVNEIEFKKSISTKITYIENIITSFIYQSLEDLIKQELKKGKVHKLIEIYISQNGNAVEILVKNNGFDSCDKNNLSAEYEKNSNIINALNFANLINAKIEINTIENEGMQYKLKIK